MGAQQRESRLDRLSRRLDALGTFVLSTERFWYQQYGKDTTDQAIAKAGKWTTRILVPVIVLAGFGVVFVIEQAVTLVQIVVSVS